MKGKTILITGASSGIGAAAAYKFASQGCRLILTGRDLAKLQRVSEVIRKDFQTDILELIFDVRNHEASAQAIHSIPDSFKPIEVFLNNAGLSRGFEPLIEGSQNDWNEMIDTNIKGLLSLSQLVGQVMTAQGYGHIIHMGSVAGKQAYPNGAVYCATKAAVDFITDAFRMEVLEKGIKVSAIHPGMVETNFSIIRFHGDTERAKAVYQGLRPLTAQDVAEAIYFMASAPAHVNVSDLVLLSADQTPEGRFNRRS
jgi:3-hydroxy acid dehydrogenase / malonic semialdehyde reductase